MLGTQTLHNTKVDNELSGQILGAAIEVHRVLGGPGLLESIYEAALTDILNATCEDIYMGGTWSKEKKHLCTKNILHRVKKAFRSAERPSAQRDKISTTDCLMSGLAVFGLKYPSLLWQIKLSSTPMKESFKG